VTVTRGTSNRNARGSSYDRARRRAWLIAAYPSDVSPDLCRCYRCGRLLYDPTSTPFSTALHYSAVELTIDRIKPGCKGGTYRRENIRPCCGACNSETGGATRA
jgi:hypothetical protein